MNLPDQLYHSTLNSERDNADWNLNFRTGIAFTISPKTTVGSQFTAFSNKRDQIAFNFTEDFINGEKPLVELCGFHLLPYID